MGLHLRNNRATLVVASPGSMWALKLARRKENKASTEGVSPDARSGRRDWRSRRFSGKLSASEEKHKPCSRK